MLAKTDELYDFKLLFDKLAQTFEAHSAQRSRLLGGSDIEEDVSQRFWVELGLYEVCCDESFHRLGAAIAVVAHSSGYYLVPAPLSEMLVAGPVASKLSGDYFHMVSSDPYVVIADAGNRESVTWSADAEKDISPLATLSGTLRFVSFTPTTTHVVCPHPTDIQQCFLLDTTSPGVFVSSDPSLDGLYECKRIDLKDVEVTTIRFESTPLVYFEYLARSAELLGLVDCCLENCVDYVKTRKQFGAPIGSFPVVQHKLADVYAFTESLRALVQHAALALDEGREDGGLAVQCARYRALGSVAMLETLLQLFGGIGFTWEHDLHLYLRRAKALSIRYRMSPADFECILEAVV